MDNILRCMRIDGTQRTHYRRRTFGHLQVPLLWHYQCVARPLRFSLSIFLPDTHLHLFPCGECSSPCTYSVKTSARRTFPKQWRVSSHDLLRTLNAIILALIQYTQSPSLPRILRYYLSK